MLGALPNVNFFCLRFTRIQVSSTKNSNIVGMKWSLQYFKNAVFFKYCDRGRGYSICITKQWCRESNQDGHKQLESVIYFDNHTATEQKLRKYNFNLHYKMHRSCHSRRMRTRNSFSTGYGPEIISVQPLCGYLVVQNTVSLLMTRSIRW